MRILIQTVRDDVGRRSRGSDWASGEAGDGMQHDSSGQWNLTYDMISFEAPLNAWVHSDET